MAETIRKYWRRLVLAVILVFVVASGLFLGGIPPVVIPPTPPVGGIYSTDLYVNAFNVETGRDGWQRVGASPWIDAEDYSTNYIYSTVNLEKIGNFTFPNMPGDAASVINATLYAKIKTVAGAIRLEIMLWNGSWRTGIYAGTNNELVWVSTNVTAILDTIIEVNNAEIYIIASNAAATYNDIVDCVYLKVYYNVNEPPECTYYEVSPKHIGKVCNFTFNWTSGTGLEYVIFSWDSGTGSMQNDTAFDPWDGSPSTGQVTITKLLPMQLLVIKYQCYANDTTGWGDSGLLNFTSITEIELETQTLNATSYNNYSIPTVWVPIYMDKTFLAQAPGAWVDCFNASAEGYYRWIKLTDIDAEYNYVKGYEIQVIASAVWKNCTAVYSSCGGENQTHFIDGNTTTYWYHSSTHNHEIIVDIGESVRTYGLHIFMENQGDWVGVDVYGAPEQGWYVNGTSPYVNASDYPANYIYQNRTNQISAIVNFQSTSYISVKQATLFANISISDTGKKIEAQYENRSEWIVIQLNVTQANTWTLVNTTIEANFTENWLIYSLNVRFRTIGGDATFRVDETYLVIQVVNMTGIETAFSSATTGRNAIHYQTDVINAMFFGFLDTNAKWYKIIAFNLLTLEWTNTSDIADAGAWG
ncbi:MAG: hypothetical protein OEZ40_09325, partial [Candidatus Bathyarchaeota archaeon]|nr:hypothetical protein [Candidatus Bathyarchaeota archaeon]